MRVKGVGRWHILLKEKMHTPPYMVSKNLSVCLFDLNYLRTGRFVDKKFNIWLKSNLDLHHLQGGMKFATQISPLLNLNLFILHFSDNSFIYVCTNNISIFSPCFRIRNQIKSNLKMLLHFINDIIYMALFLIYNKCFVCLRIWE